MYAVRVHDCKQFVACARGGASHSRVVAELDMKADILEQRLDEKGAIPFLRMI
jgi:hypothetical protein